MFVFFLDLASPAPAAPPAKPPTILSEAHICDYPSFDLDGDGIAEDFREVRDTRGTGGATYDVYLGTRKIGQVAGCWWQLGEKHHHGFRDFVSIWRLGCCEYQPTYYRFDGRRYRGRDGKVERTH
jgi:hypothetical protein